MRIVIWLETTEPPEGTIRLEPDPGAVAVMEGGRALSFAGWLGMVGALYDVLGDQPRQIAEHIAERDG